MPDRVLAETPFLRLVDRDGWSFIDRPRGIKVVTIVAVTSDEKLLLVEQLRRPLGKTVIELPAGLAGDEPGREAEAMADAAHRELVEETGYEAGRMELVATPATSPGMTDECVFFFRGRDLRKVHDGGGIGDENITVHEVPLSDIDRWLQTKLATGTPVATKVYAGLYFLSREARP